MTTRVNAAMVRRLLGLAVAPEPGTQPRRGGITDMQRELGAAPQDVLLADRPLARVEVVDLGFVQAVAKVLAEIVEPGCSAEQAVDACAIGAGVAAGERPRQPAAARSQLAEEAVEIGLLGMSPPGSGCACVQVLRSKPSTGCSFASACSASLR